MRTPAYQNTRKNDSRKMAEFLSKDGQLLLPFVELMCNTEQLAGPKQPGKSHGAITWHGRHPQGTCNGQPIQLARHAPEGATLEAFAEGIEKPCEARPVKPTI